jgi:hypothetical protein
MLSAEQPLAVGGSEGWMYKPATLEFHANTAEYGPGGQSW